jgi:hypothetical protein
LAIVATQMENALAWLSYKQRGTSPPIQGIRLFPNLGQGQSPRFARGSEFGYKPTELTEILALLHVLSGFVHVRTRLCDTRFIHLFEELLRVFIFYYFFASYFINMIYIAWGC